MLGGVAPTAQTTYSNLPKEFTIFICVTKIFVSKNSGAENFLCQYFGGTNMKFFGWLHIFRVQNFREPKFFGGQKVFWPQNVLGLKFGNVCVWVQNTI